MGNQVVYEEMDDIGLQIEIASRLGWDCLMMRDTIKEGNDRMREMLLSMGHTQDTIDEQWPDWDWSGGFDQLYGFDPNAMPHMVHLHWMVTDWPASVDDAMGLPIDDGDCWTMVSCKTTSIVAIGTPRPRYSADTLGRAMCISWLRYRDQQKEAG